MRRSRSIAVAAAKALALWLGSHLARAQKSGGVLKMPDFASPASMSIHEEVTRAAVTMLMLVFNNLMRHCQLSGPRAPFAAPLG